MASLPNYLLTNRKRLGLSQEEVGFLLGGNGQSKGSRVSRDEQFLREPSLRTALMYEVIYGRPIRELFAGVYEQIDGEVAAKAKILRLRKTSKSSSRRDELIARLTKLTE